jgi:hypothetical protein
MRASGCRAAQMTKHCGTDLAGEGANQPWRLWISPRRVEGDSAGDQANGPMVGLRGRNTDKGILAHREFGRDSRLSEIDASTNGSLTEVLSGSDRKDSDRTSGVLHDWPTLKWVCRDRARPSQQGIEDQVINRWMCDSRRCLGVCRCCSFGGARSLDSGCHWTPALNVSRHSGSGVSKSIQT